MEKDDSENPQMKKVQQWTMTSRPVAKKVKRFCWWGTACWRPECCFKHPNEQGRSEWPADFWCKEAGR
eukprot:8871225-Karenia_brevis.AAC.1